ncbi:apolipoprotein N-acyltransferase [Flavicella sp.]|uniref:apolipoprotein N-acyltransferase n=1 Tax=Flavicella sp. TaxID=2957742 RepID=UPI003017B2BB
MKKLLLSLLSGLLFAISWPTYGFPLFLFFAFIPLLLIEKELREQKVKRSILLILGYAYLSFFIFNAVTTWWLYYATPFGMYFAVLTNSLLMSLIFVLYHILAKKISQKLSLWMIVCLWIGFEKFHLNWEFSWPWLNLGNGFSEYYKWIQWYEYTGTFGGTLWIWIVNILFFYVIINFYKYHTKKAFIKSILLPISIIIIGIFGSLYMYYNTNTLENKIKVIVLQPNIDPYSEKYNTTNYGMAQKLIELAKEKLDSSVTFVIAPETTLSKPVLLNSFNKTKEYNILNTFVLLNSNISFLSGITFYDRYPASKTPNTTANFFRNSKSWYNSYNSAFFLRANKKFETYHKSKLVVGVEHIPYRNIVSPLLGGYMIDLGGSVSTLTSQKNRKVFSNNKNTIAPIICYESVYGEYVTDYVKKGADFLSIITNDGWWSTSQGHKQHLSIARLRAIENRRSIARSANTGVSALINQKGDIEQFIPYGETGSLKGMISTNTATTFYTDQGDYIFRIAMLVLVLVLLTSFTKRKQRL